MITDPIADLLVRLGNAARRRQDVVKVPVSKVKRQILNILGKEGFILGYGETQEDGCGCVLKNDDMLATLEDGTMMKVVFCDTCKKYVNKAMTASHLFLNNPKKVIAERVYKLFCELNRDADIVIVYTNKDFKKANESRGGEKLEKARQREVSIYPLGNMIKDVGAGESAMAKKIEDFLSV